MSLAKGQGTALQNKFKINIHKDFIHCQNIQNQHYIS